MKKILLGFSSLLLVLCMTGCSNNSNQNENSNSNGNDEVVQTQGIVGNNNWFAGDDSYLTFSGEEFSWYKTKEITDDNYYQGNYYVYYGQEAIDYYLDFMSSYNIDATENLNTSLEGARESGLTENNFTVLVLENKNAMLDGEAQSFDPYSSVYVGYYMESGESIVLDFINLSTGNDAYFVSE